MAIKIDKYKKLKDSIHSIVTKLSEKDILSLTQLSKELKNYNITISANVLLKLLESDIFNKKDSDWLFFDSKKKTISANFKKRSPLGKSRKKIIKKEKDEIEKSELLNRENTIDSIDKENLKIKSPIPSEVIYDTFNNIDKDIIIKIKKLIDDAIQNNLIENIYEQAWFFMINKIMPLLELTLKNKWKTHKPNSTIWAIPTLKDIDIGIIVWHFKYGKGIISSVTDQMFNINFFVPFNGKPNSNSKLMKINIVLKNKTIRIYKSHIKNQIEKKGYKPAYIKDLDQNDKIYHIARNSIGEIKNVNLIDKHINININNKTIKVPFSEFHKNQKINR